MKCLCRASPSLAEAEEDKNADWNSSLSSYLVQERNQERFLFFLGLSAQVMQDSLLDAPSISGSYNYRLKLKPACKQGNFVASQLLLARQAPRERAETEHWLIWIELARWPREREGGRKQIDGLLSTISAWLNTRSRTVIVVDFRFDSPRSVRCVTRPTCGEEEFFIILAWRNLSWRFFGTDD